MNEPIDGGYVKSFRCTMDHPVWSHHNAYRVFQWAQWKANWKTGYFHGKPVPRGSFVTGRNSGSQEVGLSPSTFQRALDKLVELGCVTLEADSQKTIVTICNYERYQGCDLPERTADGQRMDSQWTADGQRMDTIEEGKKGRREEENTKAAPPLVGPLEQTPPPKAPKPKPPPFDPLTVTLPGLLQTDAFRAAWAEWAAHKREIRKPITAISAGRQLTMLASVGHDAAIAMIHTAVTQGWKGLWRDDKKKPGGANGVANTQVNLNPIPPINYELPPKKQA